MFQINNIKLKYLIYGINYLLVIINNIGLWLIFSWAINFLFKIKLLNTFPKLSAFILLIHIGIKREGFKQIDKVVKKSRLWNIIKIIIYFITWIITSFIGLMSFNILFNINIPYTLNSLYAWAMIIYPLF